MVYNGYFFRWCPIYPKWDSYQPLCSDRTHIFSMTSLGCVIIYHGKKSDQLPTPNVGQQSVYPLVNVYETMERSTFFMGKSTISMAIFNSYVTNYQRVSWGLLRTINPEDHPMPSPVEALLCGIMNKGVLVLVRGERLQVLINWINCPALHKTHPGAVHMGLVPNFRDGTLWLCQNSYWKWPLIVDFPIKNGDFQ